MNILSINKKAIFTIIFALYYQIVIAGSKTVKFDYDTTITGIVYADTLGTPLAGATVRISSSNNGVLTDQDGTFVLKNVALPSKLYVTYMGYNPVEVEVTSINANYFRVLLKRSNSNLETIIVSTGYQKLPKERVAGSFEFIDRKSLSQRVTPNIISRLEGLSSINFDKQDGRPPIIIRGVSTINGSNAPLIVVNGFPFEGDINRINPDDVESVTILKDAAATSIWGTRAGNGVIVISTKQAKYNQPLQVSFNTIVTYSQKPDLFYLDQMSTSDFIDVEKFLFAKGYYKSQENNRTSRPPLSPVVELLIKQRDGLINNVDQQIDLLRNLSARSSYEELLYKNPLTQQYTISLKGGDQKGNYYLSGGYIGNTNELQARNDKFTFNTDANYRFNPKLKVNVGMSFIQRNTKSGAPSFMSRNSLFPYFQLEDSNGDPSGISLYRKTYTDTAAGGRLLDWKYYPLTDFKDAITRVNSQNIIGRFALFYDIIKNLSFSGNYQYERQNDYSNQSNSINSSFTRDLINKFTQVDQATGTIKYNIPLGGIDDNTNTMIVSQNARAQLNYNYSRSYLTINAIAGFEIRDVKLNSNTTRNYGVDPNVLTTAKVDYVNAYPNFLSGSRTYIPYINGISEKNNRFVSTYFNAGVTFKSRYIITGSARRDASNLFGVNVNDKWQPLWSAGLAWNVSDEDFYKSVIIPYLKFRATYGFSGNVDLSKSALTAIRYQGSPSSYTGFPMAVISQFANPDLKWEKTKMINIGVDFSLKNNTVSGSLEGYFKNGADLYGETPIDQTAGVGPTITRNVGEMKGSGIELNVNSIITKGIIGWTNNLIFNCNRSKVIKYYKSYDIGANFVNSATSISPLEGRPLYSILAYKWAGLDNSGNPQGMVDGKVTTNYYDITGAATTSSDLVFGGAATPQFFGSFINSLTWMGFSLSFNIMYKLGYSFMKPSVNYSSLFAGIVQSNDFSNRWISAGDEKRTSVPSMVYPTDYARDAFYNSSEVLIRKADHIRLSYVNLGYDFTTRQLKRLKLQQLRIYLSAENLGIIWRENNDRIDPDYLINSIPPGKAFSIGFQTTF